MSQFIAYNTVKCKARQTNANDGDHAGTGLIPDYTTSAMLLEISSLIEEHQARRDQGFPKLANNIRRRRGNNKIDAERQLAGGCAGREKGQRQEKAGSGIGFWGGRGGRGGSGCGMTTNERCRAGMSAGLGVARGGREKGGARSGRVIGLGRRGERVDETDSRRGHDVCQGAGWGTSTCDAESTGGGDGEFEIVEDGAGVHDDDAVDGDGHVPRDWNAVHREDGTVGEVNEESQLHSGEAVHGLMSFSGALDNIAHRAHADAASHCPGAMQHTGNQKGQKKSAVTSESVHLNTASHKKRLMAEATVRDHVLGAKVKACKGSAKKRRNVNTFSGAGNHHNVSDGGAGGHAVGLDSYEGDEVDDLHFEIEEAMAGPK